MRAILPAAVAAFSLAASSANAVEGAVIWSGVVPDSLQITQFFETQSGGRYYFLTDGDLIGIPTFDATFHFTNRYYMGSDLVVIPLPDLDISGMEPGPWRLPALYVEHIDGGLLIGQGGAGIEIDRRSCCFNDLGDADPYFLHENLTQNLLVSAKFEEGSAGKNFSLIYAGMGLPEPATWVAMILGFGMVGGALRHRRAALLQART